MSFGTEAEVGQIEAEADKKTSTGPSDGKNIARGLQLYSAPGRTVARRCGEMQPLRSDGWCLLVSSPTVHGRGTPRRSQLPGTAPGRVIDVTRCEGLGSFIPLLPNPILHHGKMPISMGLSPIPGSETLTPISLPPCAVAVHDRPLPCRLLRCHAALHA